MILWKMHTPSVLSANVFWKPVRMSNKINYDYCGFSSITSSKQSACTCIFYLILHNLLCIQNEVAWKNPFVHYAPASTACHYLHCRDVDVYKWIQNIFVFVLFRLSTIRQNILWEIFLVNSSWQISHLFFTMDS